ncbi:MAG TPA: hypothetical protein ENK85_04700 [Saprospiraceae bacterium]|nr:hypothetical protein [Saprospiraceae bacterium]
MEQMKMIRIIRYGVLMAAFIYGSVGFSQLNFVKYGNNPVLTRHTVFGAWDAIAVSDPQVLWVNDTLRMWYTGVGWLSMSDTSVHQRIGYAWSLDGIDWNPYPNNPVLDKTDNSWDNKGVETPTVLIDPTAPPSERFKMWYAGQNVSTDLYEIGYAYSPDGLHWTKSNQNPVLQVGDSTSWENGYLEGPSVLLVHDTLRMWYASVDLTGNGSPTDYTGNIGYAWSLDGIHWNKHPGNPIFTSYNSTTWDQASVADPHVIFKDGEYRMFYAGLHTWAQENFKMGYATSKDGIHWSRPVANPVLETGNPGAWDDEDASYGCAIYNPSIDKYQMWYTGLDTNVLGADLNSFYYDIGYATADVVLSTNQPENQLLDLSIYPIPCGNSLAVEAKNHSQIKSAHFYDALGKAVEIPVTFSGKKLYADTRSLKPGMYFCSVITVNNRVLAGLFFRV